MSLLQTFLLANGIFSFLSGCILIFFRKAVTSWFGRKNQKPFWIIGIVLILFSYTVLVQAFDPQEKAVAFIILQDFIWVIGSIIILLFKPFSISTNGNKIIAFVALGVLLFGIGQSIGLSKVDQISADGMKRMSYERMVRAPKQEAWRVISDIANYEDVAPNIDHVEVISGVGVGTVRKCSHQADSWTEVATLWEEGERYSFQVNTDAPDYPYPLKYLKGTWTVKAISPEQTQIIMDFDFSYKSKIQHVIIHPFLKAQFNQTVKELLDNWQSMLEG